MKGATVVKLSTPSPADQARDLLSEREVLTRLVAEAEEKAAAARLALPDATAARDAAHARVLAAEAGSG
jgi:hypothetical protein